MSFGVLIFICATTYASVAQGSVIVNSKPPLGRLVTEMSPPWKRMAFLTIDKPRPVPPSLR